MGKHGPVERVAVMGGELTVSRIEKGAITSSKIRDPMSTAVYRMLNNRRCVVRVAGRGTVDVWIGHNEFMYVQNNADTTPLPGRAGLLSPFNIGLAYGEAARRRCGVTVECDPDGTYRRIDADLDQPHGWVVFLRVPE